MSRTTVTSLLRRNRPPRYERKAMPSKLDGYRELLAELLDNDPDVSATAALDVLRDRGFDGSISIVRDHLGRLRQRLEPPHRCSAAASRPGALGQVDWWQLPIHVPLGEEAVPGRVWGVVVTLVHSEAHAVTFVGVPNLHAFVEALLRSLGRLGGVPSGLSFDVSASVAARLAGGAARMQSEIAELLNQLIVEPTQERTWTVSAHAPQLRTAAQVATQFVHGLRARSLDELQAKHDVWAADVAAQRVNERLQMTIGDAWRMEVGHLRPLPDPIPRLQPSSEHGRVRIETPITANTQGPTLQSTW